MMKIGLTGGIGSGKSVVARIFRSLGTPVYYADDKAKYLMQNELKDDLIRLFGERAFHNGKLNRKFLAGVVFQDREKLELLNSIVHPAVKQNFIDWAADFKNAPYIIQESALIFESNTNKLLDYTIVVHASEEIRIQRIMDRDNTSEDEVKARMKNQMDPEKKRKSGDFVIINEGNNLLTPTVLDFHNKFVSLQS